MSYKLQTTSGLNFYHCSSAMQKYIRRGEEHKALWYATELYSSNFQDYCWYRIRVMVSEDIGIANPTLPAQIESLYQTYQALAKKKPSSARLPFIHAIMLLVRSPKSRLVDNKLCYYFELRHHVPQPPLDDYVFDMHTIEGKIKKRGNAHFFAEAAHIENAPIADEFIFRDEVARLYEIEDSKPKPPKPSKSKPTGGVILEPIVPTSNLFDDIGDPPSMQEYYDNSDH